MYLTIYQKAFIEACSKGHYMIIEWLLSICSCEIMFFRYPRDFIDNVIINTCIGGNIEICKLLLSKNIELELNIKPDDPKLTYKFNSLFS